MAWRDPIRASNTPSGTKASPTLQAQYDSSVGKSSTPSSNQSVITDPVTGNSYSRDTSNPNSTYAPYTAQTPQTNAVTSDNLKPATPMKLPDPGMPDTTGTGIMSSMAALGIPNITGSTTDASGKTTSTGPTNFKDMLTSMYQAPASSEDIYNKTIKEEGLRQKEATVAGLQGQITSITNQATADKLGLVGQGRGITDTIIGGQQAQIDREAAIRSLPIAAQLAAAQDDLTSARAHVDTLFQIRSADAKAQTDYQNKIIDTVFAYASDQQKEALADRRKEEDRTFQRTSDAINYAQQLSIAAINNGQSAVAARIMALDPNSTTYAKDVAAASKSIVVVKSSGNNSNSSPSKNLKGKLSDKTFVERTLNAQNLAYDPLVTKLMTDHPDQIPVIQNSDGQIGTIPPNEYDSSKYTKL